MSPDQTIEFHTGFAVKPKQSDRHRVVFPAGAAPFARRYSPPKVLHNADVLRLLFARYAPVSPLKGPIRLTLIFTSPWRLAMKKRDRSRGRMPKDTQPDADNLCKQVCDVLEKSRFFANDGQISTATVRKRWGPETMLFVRLEPDDCEHDEDLESEANDGT